MSPTLQPTELPTGSPEVSERLVTRVLWSLGLGLALAIGLVLFTPRLPPPPPSPAQPDGAFVDNAHMVSPAYARSTAGALLNDPRAQFVGRHRGGIGGILVFAGVTLGIAALGVFFAVNTLWRLATLPRNWHNRRVRFAPKVANGSIFRLGADLELFELAMGPAGFALCFVMTGFVLVQADDYFTRKGHFGGAGATAAVTWPAAPS